MSPERIAIEVACAEAERQTSLALEVPAGSTAGEAVVLSGICARHPGSVLRAGDRVEVLRPLAEDPRERRRRLAREGRSMKAGSTGRG